MEKLKNIRIQKGISILELSRKSGVSERYLRFIENGEKTPSLKTAQAIATSLEVKIDEIL